MKRKNIFHVTILFIMLFLSACGNAPTALPDNEIKNIQIATTSAVKSMGNQEEFPLPNCGGTGKLAQSLGTQVSVSKTVEMGTTVSIGGGGEIAIPETAKISLQAAIEAAYKQEYETANSRLDTITMEAAPKTHVIYTIQWEKQVFSSVATFEFNREAVQTPYVFTMSIPKIERSREQPCVDGFATQIPAAQPTAELNILPSTPSECISPQVLAQQKGWAEMGWADKKYGGLRVNLSHDDELPLLWEALGTKSIYQDSNDRHMLAGVWTIYPPFACRDILGFSR